MIKQTPGKIYLADQRGLTESPQFRRYSTLNFGTYTHEHKGAIGNLLALNEEILAGVQRVTLQADQPSHVIILPITGAIDVHDPLGNLSTLDVGEVQVSTLEAGSSVQIGNPYEADLVSFLHIWIKAEEPIGATSQQVFTFDFETIENTLAEIIVPSFAGTNAHWLPFSLHLGRFAGRRETVYALPNDSLLFAFVVAGAFEVEGRLLHEKDSLALWDVEEVEVEALSNNALVVVLAINNKGLKLG